MAWLNVTAEVNGEEIPVMKRVGTSEYSMNAKVEIKEGDALVFAGVAEQVVSVNVDSRGEQQIIATNVVEVSEEKDEEDDSEQVPE